MDYSYGLPHGSSWTQPLYYDPYSYAHHNAAALAPSYCHHPPPPGTERDALAAAYAPSYCHQPPPPGTEVASASSLTSSAVASYHAVVAGANPAAASAVASFTSPMGASERSMSQQLSYASQYPPAQHPDAVGDTEKLMGGRRFGVLSHGMGRGRGGSMYHPRIQNVGVSSPRGRGQGRGRGRGSKGSGRKLEIHAPSDSSAAEAQPGTASEPLHIQDVVQVTTATISWEPVLPAWCDICRVRCNNKEILEQHKNGKRHKRTVQVMQDMAGLQDLIPSIPDLANPVSQVAKLPLTSWQLVEGPSTALHRSPPVSSSCLGGGEHNDLAPENVIAAVAGVQVTEATTGSSAQQNTVPPTTTVGHSVGAQIEAH